MTRMIHVFERTNHEAHEWVNDLAGRTGWTNEREVLRLLRTVLARRKLSVPTFAFNANANGQNISRG